MSSLDDYNNQFEVFESEVNYGFKNICLHYAINILTIERQEPINKTPEFWSYTLYNLVTVSILTLGRIFDYKSDYSIHKLLKIIGENKKIFSFSELKLRKGNIDFEEYITDKVEFNCEMYRNIAISKKSLLKKYEKPYRNFRNSIIGHRLVKESFEVEGYDEFQYNDILNIYIGLYNLSWELRERYHNGRGAIELTHEKLTSQIHSIEDGDNVEQIPRYLYMARDYWKLYFLLEKYG